MNIRTIVRFLAGRREAILEIAHCRAAIFLAALFVVSAGFAREYDVEDLRHEPWHLALPLVASFASATLLYLIIYAASWARSAAAAPFWSTYRRFLTLFWMMAPMAWLYAIPVERWMTPGDAVQTNLWFLAIVSAWRVILISRCASVLFGGSFLAMFWKVMFFADTVALVILNVTPLPIFNIMGGIRLTESEMIIRDTAMLVNVVGIVTWGIWCVGAIGVSALGKDRWPWFAAAEPDVDVRVSATAWGLGVLSIAVWAPILPVTQPPQQLRRQVEDHLAAGRIENAVQVMSQHGRDAFPPHWDPPPWVGYGDDAPPVVRILQIALKSSADQWVIEVYLDKWSRQLAAPWIRTRLLTEIDDLQFEAVVDVIDRSEEARKIVEGHSISFREALESDDQNGGANRRDRARRLLEALEVEASPTASPMADDR